MRLLIIDGSDFESYPPGGSKIYIKNFLRFIDQNIDISLAGITTNRDLFRHGRIKATIAGREYTFYAFACVPRLAEGKKPTIPIRIRAFCGLLRRIHWILRERFDVAYVHFPELAFPILYPLKRLPVVFHLHGVVDAAVPLSRYAWLRNRIVARAFREMNRLVLERADRVLVVSEEGLKVCHALAPKSASHTAIIPPSVDRDLFQPRDKRRSRLELGLPETANIIVSAGRLESAKGMDLLLEAFMLVAEERSNIHLIVAGEGSERRFLEQRAAGSPVAGRIRFLGEVNHERTLPLLFNAADVFALASKSEGLPTVILEALSCGVPVVSTAVGDIPKVIRDGQTGFLVHTRDPKDFATALARTLDVRDTLASACQMVAETYSAARIAPEILNHLTNAVHGRRHVRR